MAEIRREAADAKHEAEIKALEQKQAMETQVTQYRVELERQQLEQRQAFELEAQKTQATLEAKIQSQIEQAFQRRAPATSPGSVSDSIPISPALASLLETQSQQLTMLTHMMAAMTQRDTVLSPATASQVPTPPTQTTSGLKRRSAEIIDLTTEESGPITTGVNLESGTSSDRTKKHDSKETPSSKIRAPPIGDGPIYGMQIPNTPASANSSMSVITPQGRSSPPLFESYHPPSIHRSPISWAEAGRSPLSNLAMRPEYQFGPEDSMTSEIATAQVPMTQPPDMDDSLFSEDNRLQDIHATLGNEHQTTSDEFHQRAATPIKQEPSPATDSVPENNPCHGQTTPGDHDISERYHEL